jgi:hypothetical protein
MHEFASTEKEIPKTLFLQLDNTTRQNKGKYLMAYLSLLVEHGVFDEVRVNFLPKGHTHEDVDQLFSRLGVLLRTQDAWDHGQILEAARKIDVSKYGPTDGSRKSAFVYHLDTIANFSEWVSDKIKPLPDGIMQWNAFRIHRKSGTYGRAALQARPWPGDDSKPWLGIGGGDVYNMVFDENISFPTFNPVDLPEAQRQEPWPEDTKTKILSGIRKMKEFYKIPDQHIDNLHKEVGLCSAPQDESKKCTWEEILHKKVLHQLDRATLEKMRQECFEEACGRTNLGLRTRFDEDPRDNVNDPTIATVTPEEIRSQNLRSSCPYEIESLGQEEKGRVVKKDEIYLIKPGNGNDKFWVGKIVKPQKRTFDGCGNKLFNGALVQYFYCKDKGDPFGRMYPRRYQKHNELDFCYSTEMKMKLKDLVSLTTAEAQGEHGNFRFNALDLPKVKDLVEKWEEWKTQDNGLLFDPRSENSE